MLDLHAAACSSGWNTRCADAPLVLRSRHLQSDSRPALIGDERHCAFCATSRGLYPAASSIRCNAASANAPRALPGPLRDVVGALSALFGRQQPAATSAPPHLTESTSIDSVQSAGSRTAASNCEAAPSASGVALEDAHSSDSEIADRLDASLAVQLPADTFSGGPHAQAAWAAAWEPLQPPSQQPSRKKGNRRISKGSSADSLVEEQGSKEVRKPTLALQGLAAAPRMQLIALSLVALEKHVSMLPPDFTQRGTAAEWRLLLPALLASCSVAAAQGWLGYTPPVIQREAAILLDRLRTGSRRPAEPVPDAGRNTLAGLEPGAVGSQHPWEAATAKAPLHASVLRHLVGPEPASAQSASTESADAESPSPPKPGAAKRPWCTLPRFFIGAGDLPLRTEQPAAAPDAMSRQPPRVAVRGAAMQLMSNAPAGIRGWGSEQTGPPAAVTSSSRQRRAPVVLQDMAVTAAEAVAAAYLSEAGLGPGGEASGRVLGSEDAWPTFLHPRLSTTRALERFRNQVAFQRLVDDNWGQVVAIHEDKHLLWGVGRGGSLLKRSLPSRRTQEVRRLKGWRAAVSLLLEALDFLAPILQGFSQRAGRAIAWLLVALIGRSLGLIFRGVRQSLTGNRPKRPPMTNAYP